MNGTDVATATWERYSTSDVRIAPANENFPYTEKFTGCGLPGRFISLTPGYISNRKVGLDALHDIYGTPNKVIVHEWGHFRWGLFDEYPRYDSFYQDLETGNVEATRCVRSIPGEIRNIRTGKPCGVDDYNSDGLPDSSTCVFIDDMEAKTYSASIMYKQYLSNNEQFCDDPTRPGVPDTVAHNPMAPNEQNNKCQQRSSWEVLRAHPDFEDTDSLDPKPVRSTDPEFIIVRQKLQTTTVLVLDISGSMEGERLVLLQQASANIIENVLPMGSRLGIIAFSEYATVRHDIVEIDSQDTRRSLLNSLPKKADGRTSIGRGVELAVQKLREYESDPAGSTLIVITDGEQNSHPYIQDVLQKTDNLTVNTVAVGGEADGELELLAVHTGGDSFSHTDKSSEIYLSFFKAAAAQMSQSQVTDTVIDADFVSIPLRETFTNKFHLDDALTGGLKITIAYIWTLRPADVSFLLVRPDGLPFHNSNLRPPRFTTEPRYKQIKINLGADDVVAGEWTLNVTNQGSFQDDFNIVIQPRVKEGTTPIIATAQWAVPSVTPPNRQILFVFVQQGDTPVTEARVQAQVRLNTNAQENNTVTIVPHDDGIGADITKDDGIYSAYFTSFLGKGRHGVEVRVSASHETKLSKGGLVGYGAASNPAFASEERTIVTEYTGDFQREITGGSFECTTTDCGNSSVDLYPPSRIHDLSVVRVHDDSLVLRFSAPGDDLAAGSATKYEIRYSANFTEITKDFQSSNIVPENWITDFSHPRKAGAAEKFTIKLLDDTVGTTLIFGIVAIDEANNQGERSNLVVLQSTPTASAQKGWPPGAIAGVALSMFIILLCILIVGLVYVWRRKSAPSKSPCNGHHPVSV
ncbi:calcium-activated chloride channel regulator 1 isoform X2 [Strongylocentrotus purpuratus]|uniref:VWFA domain-containing protein n=1 Tax=Strongylocentrotus purpuratus TaxID=7668 RepID=A0A7M7P346_STRPU|nr:calcium-activated chloride channel regulator 1 isoform X2 [Strongylocentrotus purpuratus]